ncbi:hypothetical protein [Campylobacter sp. RM12651]|uniref:hypothetical protein n=1 Tax=Campylobacter sp. RM12651 TaxID=1660079 RepID=UPI001EFB9001|nr:hypothetical protein [Campylobacter sp. RM12651]ULO04557.1 hypothetical protein AVBRAN_a0075 [Campylobacter sp. RM12651]
MEKEIKELEKMLKRKSNKVLVKFAVDFISILSENIDCIIYKAENNVYEFGIYWDKDNKENEEFIKIDKKDLKENIISLMCLLPVGYENNDAYFDDFITADGYTNLDYLKCEAIKSYSYDASSKETKSDFCGKKITFAFLDGKEYIFNIFEEQDKPLVKTVSRILKELK